MFEMGFREWRHDSALRLDNLATDLFLDGAPSEITSIIRAAAEKIERLQDPTINQEDQ